ncbi:MAG: HAD-IC family P-type ATPase [Candidatus Kapabacteria bacterium]|nr:HAD-IC family P-type ATPase [Candidatus Kapabacteria bacterium]
MLLDLVPSHIKGLSEDEVKERESKNLTNQTKKTNGYVNYFQIVIENTFTLFNLINFLIISFLFYFYFTKQDERLLLDSVGILVVIGINISFSIYQKIKSVRALKKIELLKNKKVKVVRDSKVLEIDISSIVLNDIILITKGDQIPVDSKVIKSMKFEVDESLITGESLPIAKFDNDDLLSGSYCVNGLAYIEVKKVGLESYTNTITQFAKKIKINTSPLMNKINLIFTVSFLITLVLIFIEGVLIGRTESIDIESIRKISTIAFTLIPEGLIFFTTFTIVIGIYNISKIGAIIQKLNAIDSFSTVDIICLDKTGTITKNKILIHKIISIDENTGIDLLKRYLGDFYQLSLHKNSTIGVFSSFNSENNLLLLDQIPFDSELKYSVVLQKKNDTNHLYILGSFETIIEKLDQRSQYRLNTLCDNENITGYRNLLFCYIPNYEYEKIQNKIFKHPNLKPMGIISLKDEVREDIESTLTDLKQINKEIKILTGDSIDATFSVLKEVGLCAKREDIFDGNNLKSISDDETLEIVTSYDFFARLTPSQKLRIVKILKQTKKQICFIGDGLNDLPAIKEADLGIAMDSGVTATKEVSDIILLKNKFSLLPDIFKEGNRIINTVTFIVLFYLIKNFSVFLMVLLNWIFLLPFPLTPRRSSLLSALAIGLPSYFVSLKNKRVNDVSNFWKDVSITVISASLTSLLFIYLSNYFSHRFLMIKPIEADYILFSIFILSSIANFYFIVAFRDFINRKNYLVYTILMILIFILFSAIKLNFFPFNIITDFYEVMIMDIHQWLIVVIFSIFSFMALFFIHFLISKISDSN